MTTLTRAVRPTQPPLLRRISTFFLQHPTIALILMLLPSLLWLGVLYIGSLSQLLLNSFFQIDPTSFRVVREFTWDNYIQLTTASHLTIVGRTALIAAIVTVASALIAFPLAYYMARYANRRIKGLLYLAVMIPLWSSYLVRVYAWRLVLSREGIISWLLNGLGLDGVLQVLLDSPIGGRTLAQSYLGLTIVFIYIWFPYMILPIATALERVPKSVIEASGDLGARPRQTFWTVILPLAMPGVIAGSIFTFSLTLGDYIVPTVFGNSAPIIGSAVYSYQGASNLPLAAALTVVPVVIMIIYLTLARRTGAFDAL